MVVEVKIGKYDVKSCKIFEYKLPRSITVEAKQSKMAFLARNAVYNALVM